MFLEDLEDDHVLVNEQKEIINVNVDTVYLIIRSNQVVTFEFPSSSLAKEVCECLLLSSTIIGIKI